MYTYFLAQHLIQISLLSINTQWPKLHRSKAKHNTTQHNSKLHHGQSPIQQYHLIKNHHHHHRPNRISLPQRTTTTTTTPAANPNTPTTSRLYPVYPFTPSSSSSSSTPSKHCLSSLPSFTSNSKPIAASAWTQSRSPNMDLWTSSMTTDDLATSNLLCFFRVIAVRFWEKFCGFNFCLGALKMGEKGEELKFEYCVFCLLENKTHSYTFWNRKVFVFGGFSGFEFLKF